MPGSGLSEAADENLLQYPHGYNEVHPLLDGFSRHPPYSGFTVATKQKIRRQMSRTFISEGAVQCRQKFLRFFPAGFTDPNYLAWERAYKWKAHQTWNQELNREEFRSLLIAGHYVEIASRAVRIESRTNLLFSFEKMALRDAVKSIAGACSFSTGLYDFLYGSKAEQERFSIWCSSLQSLPRIKTRVLTWPLATVFPFIALPDKHIFLKPNVTREAAKQYDFPFEYEPGPSWSTYANLLKFGDAIRRDLADLEPKDMIDIQSFIWVQGSSEYDE
ncbi:MAG TPA: hypothetical protein VFE02_03005 [Candidatus Acidoferrales bacterium]|nr:hypothetical protein [Candidatus Acidoferrales bacterium]